MESYETNLYDGDGKDDETFCPQTTDFMKDVQMYTERRRKSSVRSTHSEVYYEGSERRPSFSLNSTDMDSLANMASMATLTKDFGIEKTESKTEHDLDINILNLDRTRSHSLDAIMVGNETRMDHKLELKRQKYISSLEHQVNELQNELKIAGKLGQNLYKMSKSKDSEINKLMIENNRLKTLNQDLNDEILVLRKHTEMDQSTYESHVSDLKEKLVTNEERQDNIIQEMNNMTQEIKKLQMENQRLTQMNDEIEFDNTTLKQEMDYIRENASYEIENTSREYAFVKDQSSNLRKKNMELTQQLESVKTKYLKLLKNENSKNGNSTNNGNDNNGNNNNSNNNNGSGSSSMVMNENESNNNNNNSSNINVFNDLNRELNLKTTEVEGLTEQLNDCKQFLDHCLFLLEEYILERNENRSIELSQIYSDCGRVRRFLGKSGLPPQPKQKSEQFLSEKKEMSQENVIMMENESKEKEMEREKEREKEEALKKQEKELSKEMEKKMEKQKEKEKELAQENEKLKAKMKTNKNKKNNKKTKTREPTFEDQKIALINFFTKFSNPKNWKESSKVNGIQTYELEFWQCEPLRARMVFLYSMTLYLSQIVGINKRCISHAWMLFKSPSAQIDTLCEEFDLILTTLEHHNDKKLWKYIFSFLYNVATYFKHIQKFVGSRTPIAGEINKSSSVINTPNSNSKIYRTSSVNSETPFRRVTDATNVYGTTSDTQSVGSIDQ